MSDKKCSKCNQTIPENKEICEHMVCSNKEIELNSKMEND